ncbi:MAG: glycosyltransferase family 2 protein [Deltaproteobacteria bacterium]|nr:glycosyltransferase family 2 protein [Deltaproteobacteria bacterium]
MLTDLLLTGPSAGESISWPHGEVLRVESLGGWLAGTRADALLFWDSRLGIPDARVLEGLLHGRGDVWHAGLRLGTGGQPGLLDFVAPNWMLNCDPPADIEATSWRVSPAACLVRTTVLRQLGLPCNDFDTLAGAMLEWGHRAIKCGAFVRHVPRLVRSSTNDVESPSLVDELRFISYRYSRFWAQWASARAGLTGYASPGQLLRAWRSLPAQRPYAEPAAYRSERSLGVPELPRARVTVLIPTLNRYPYLHVVLENLCAQTLPPHEVILIDQSDADRREPDLAAKYPDLTIRHLFRDSPGQCSSRNAGLRASTGDFIMFLDDDDELVPDLIERHLRNLYAFDADVASGSIVEVGQSAPPAGEQFTRASDVFPTGNSLVRREVLQRTGLFDLAFDRAPRADGELGMRVYLSGAFMVLDQSVPVMHHRASEGGLRTHRARAVTYRMSREMLRHRNLPHISEIYLLSRYFTERQLRESLWLRTFGTLAGRGTAARRAVKALIGGVQLPDTLKQIAERRRASEEWLTRFPQIETLD